MRHPDLELSSYLDGELDAPAREAVESHLRDCVECAALCAELRSVITDARTLEDRVPETDLWSGITRRIGEAPAVKAPPPSLRRPTPVVSITRRFTFSLTQLAAAAVIVALLSGSLAWWALRASTPAAGRASEPVATAAPGVEASTADFEIRHYDQAVAELQRALDENHGRLDPETVRTVESNLAVIDAAIVQARRALVADPANPYLSGHLAEQMKRKIRVLQRTADAVSADYEGGAS